MPNAARPDHYTGSKRDLYSRSRAVFVGRNAQGLNASSARGSQSKLPASPNVNSGVERWHGSKRGIATAESPEDASAAAPIPQSNMWLLGTEVPQICIDPLPWLSMGASMEVTVCLQNLPEALCSSHMMETVLDQARIKDLVRRFRIEKREPSVEAFLTVVDQSAADKCIWHFQGCEWGEAGCRVLAFQCWDTVGGLSHTSHCYGKDEESHELEQMEINDVIMGATDRLLAVLLAPNDEEPKTRKKGAARCSESRQNPFFEGMDASTEEGVSSVADSLEGNESAE